MGQQVQQPPQVARQTQQNRELALDVSADEARALHRVVRALHDGHCPNCSHIDISAAFWTEAGYRCPKCKFIVTTHEAKEAVKAFAVYMKKSVEIFERWRKGTNGPA